MPKATVLEISQFRASKLHFFGKLDQTTRLKEFTSAASEGENRSILPETGLDTTPKTLTCN